jgi:hypothetical protein
LIGGMMPSFILELCSVRPVAENRLPQSFPKVQMNVGCSRTCQG